MSNHADTASAPDPSATVDKPPRFSFARAAWFTLGITIFVILWGAFVRATGSGAGCGSHWPTCNGEVIPRAELSETLIEFTHRLTSGIAFLMVLGLLIWAFRRYEKGHLVRKAAAFSMFFMVTEAAIGAGLVLFELVADNDSMARAVVLALHLINTFLLLAAMTLMAWWSSAEKPLPTEQPSNTQMVRWLGFGLFGLVILGASGAVTALGDTIFPAESLAEGLAEDLSPTAHILIRLRIWHPALALIVGLYLMWCANGVLRETQHPQVRTLARLLWGLVALQLALGLINVPALGSGVDAIAAPLGLRCALDCFGVALCGESSQMGLLSACLLLNGMIWIGFSGSVSGFWIRLTETDLQGVLEPVGHGIGGGFGLWGEVGCPALVGSKAIGMPFPDYCSSHPGFIPEGLKKGFIEACL